MNFIELEKKHIKDALNLVWKVFKEFNAKDYSLEGVREFKKFIKYESIIEKFNKGELNFYGAIDNNNLVGVIATKNISHICMLFIDKPYHRREVGRNLFKIVEDKCKSKNNITKITVNSSPYAIEFYKKIGFIIKNKEQKINGLRFISMEYLINNIPLKLLSYLEAKEKNCNLMLKENYYDMQKSLNEIKKIIKIIQNIKNSLEIYNINESNLNEENLLELLDYLIIIYKDNIKHLVKCSGIIRNQNFSNINFFDHVPACVNLTVDFKCMNECILAFFKELQRKFNNISFEKKLQLLDDIDI